MTARAVLLAPHHDDETLFAAYLALEHDPDLIVCTRADVQEQRGLPIRHLDRATETSSAWAFLSASSRSWVQWPHTDVPHRTDYRALEADVAALAGRYDLCIAPAWEAGGHEHHNAVGAAAMRAFGPDRTIRYLTYRRGHGRTTGTPVEIQDPAWVVAKLRALACYVTQIREPSTRPWFLDGLTEYVLNEPPAPPPEPDPMSPAQRRYMFALLREHGIEDRDDRLAYCSEALQRPVETTRTLTFDDASTLINALIHDLPE